MKRLTALSLIALICSAAAAAPAAGKGRPIVKNALLVATGGFFVPSGMTGGDLYGGTGEIRQGGAAVGRSFSACVAATPTRGICNATLVWTGVGRIQIAGTVRNTATHNIVSVVGGSGDFRGARGTMELNLASQDGSRQRVKLRIWL